MSLIECISILSTNISGATLVKTSMILNKSTTNQKFNLVRFKIVELQLFLSSLKITNNSVVVSFKVLKKTFMNSLVSLSFGINSYSLIFQRKIGEYVFSDTIWDRWISLKPLPLANRRKFFETSKRYFLSKLRIKSGIKFSWACGHFSNISM